MQKKLAGPIVIIGVMGGAKASLQDKEQAYELGKMIAENGWLLLNGGRNSGIMDYSAQGACEHGGLTIGILPGSDLTALSKYIHIPIVTGMGSARNNVNVLSSRVVVAMAGGAGTISEIALALKQGKPVILLGISIEPLFKSYRQKGQLLSAQTPADAVSHIRRLIGTESVEA
jgi:uncharacterized protein (TIGR00725 family)